MNNDSNSLKKRSALGDHIALFSSNGFFSPATVRTGLDRVHGTSTGFKGAAIAAFNSVHSGHCPFNATKLPSEGTDWSTFLHLGTTRIWNASGEIDEARWLQFVTTVTTQQGEERIVTRSALQRYLQACDASDPQEQNTARHASNSLFATVQSTAASQAWDEAYNRLTCGWVKDEKTQEYDSYMSLEIIRLFFENPAEAFKKAERQELPVAKPADPASRAHIFPLCCSMTA